MEYSAGFSFHSCVRQHSAILCSARQHQYNLFLSKMNWGFILSWHHNSSLDRQCWHFTLAVKGRLIIDSWKTDFITQHKHSLGVAVVCMQLLTHNAGQNTSAACCPSLGPRCSLPQNTKHYLCDFAQPFGGKSESELSCDRLCPS